MRFLFCVTNNVDECFQCEVTRLKLHLTTAPFLPGGVEDATFRQPETLYYYENLSIPRLEDAFEAPLGYWSTYADDWPVLDSGTVPDEEDSEPPGPQRRLKVKFLGVMEDSTLAWGQCLHYGDDLAIPIKRHVR